MTIHSHPHHNFCFPRISFRVEHKRGSCWSSHVSLRSWSRREMPLTWIVNDIWGVRKVLTGSVALYTWTCPQTLFMFACHISFMSAEDNYLMLFMIQWRSGHLPMTRPDPHPGSSHLYWIQYLDPAVTSGSSRWIPVISLWYYCHTPT